MGELPPDARELPVAIERAELLQQRDPVADLAAVGRVEEREVLDVPEPQRGHLEDHGRQVGPQDLGVRECRACVEVLLVVEPDAHAGGDAPATPLALVRRRL